MWVDLKTRPHKVSMSLMIYLEILTILAYDGWTDGHLAKTQTAPCIALCGKK